MTRSHAAIAALLGGVILAAHASARERLSGQSARTILMHELSGAAIVAALVALGWLAIGRRASWPDGGLPDTADLGQVIDFPATRLGRRAA